jgi:hypothetical protein
VVSGIPNEQELNRLEHVWYKKGSQHTTYIHKRRNIVYRKGVSKEEQGIMEDNISLYRRKYRGTNRTDKNLQEHTLNKQGTQHRVQQLGRKMEYRKGQSSKARKQQ